MALIGISGSIIKDLTGVFAGYKRAYVNEDYIHAILKAGGTPLILPVVEDEAVIKDLVSKLDGLILSGGHDVAPQMYGENPLRKLGETFPERDSFDMKLIEFAKDRTIPILGICRGFQILNVYHGGTLYQDLDYLDNKDALDHSQQSGPDIVNHSITIDETSMFFEITQSRRLFVNSFHHQALKKVGESLSVVAKADDGVVEAFESSDYPWLLAVQFHPEMLHRKDDRMQNIFNELVIQSKKGINL